MDEMKTWRTLSRHRILDLGRYLAVELHRIELPDGRVIEDWPWVITPDYVNVVVETRDGKWLCFRQTKYAVVGTSLATIGGYIELGEDPLAAAKRETLEETGYRAREWNSLGHYAIDGNRGAGTAHFFFARGAHKVAEIEADDLEEQELLILGRNEVRAALEAGAFKVLPWAAIVAIALQWPQQDRTEGT